MSETTCRCGRPTRDDAWLCDGCVDSLERALSDCAWLDEELDTTISRQRSAGQTGGARSAEKPLPFHEKAAEAKRTLHGLLASWVRFADEEGVRGKPNWYPQDNLVSMSRWLLHVTRGLAFHDIAPDAHDEITDAVRQCDRIVFWKRKQRTYLGTCAQTVRDEDGEVVNLSCGGEVYAEEGEPVGHCDECEQGVTVVVRQAELNRELHDRLFTAAELARVAVVLGLDVPRETVRRKVNHWREKKRIEQKGTADNGDPTFRYGDVRLMLYAEYARDTA